MLNYVFLILAIVAEAAGTTFLKMSEQFTKLVPSIASLVCYVASLYLLSLCLRTIPIGIAYATWSALGIALNPLAIKAFLQKNARQSSLPFFLLDFFLRKRK